MPLSLHLAIHALLAILVGYLAGRYFKMPALMMLVAILAGFFVDLDHALQYLFHFKSFDISGFLASRQFIDSGQFFLYFHAWEWVVLGLVVAFLSEQSKIFKAVMITASLALFVHLVSDCFINQLPPRFYSIIYRAERNFLVSEMVDLKNNNNFDYLSE